MPKKTNVRDKVNRLRAFLARERRMPGYAEMLELFEYQSKNAVYQILRKLEREGYVTIDQGKAAPTGKLTGAVRVLGAVRAGFPSPAEEELIDTISLDDYLIERPEATFMLKVTGDSMVDAGIYPGDMVLVEKGVEPRNNDIVIAQVDGDWTMKYFVRDRDGVRLEPANRNYDTIRPENDLEIGGIVRSVIRKFT
jgi:repressor LexA